MSNFTGHRTIQSSFSHGTSHIPLPKSYKPASCEDKFKGKFEDAERQRKALLIQNEKTLREFNDLDRKFQLLKLENKLVQSELEEKTKQLKELSSVSQSFYREYDTLKNQYAIETTAMHRALSEAEQWYKQNQQLKRLSALPGGTQTSLLDVVDSGEDLEALRHSVKELSASNARLQSELNEAKLGEFEATEQVINLTQEVESLQKHCKTLESELKDIKQRNEQLVRVSNKMTEELLNIKHTGEKQKENLTVLRKEADEARKERNVLAHQSNILLQGISLDNDKIMLIQEIEQLKRSLEDNTNKYERHIAELQDKLEEREDDPRLEVTEERLKLAEAELQHAREKIEALEKQYAPPAPPIPPPPPMVVPPPPPTVVPPPPPPPPPSDITPLPKVVLRKVPKQITIDNPEVQAVQNGIENIVNQIKGGQFTLKSTNKAIKQKEREEPKAVSEMLKILGTLRRSPKTRNSLLLTHGTTDF